MGGRGPGGSRSKTLLEGAVKQMLVRRHGLRLLDGAGSWVPADQKTRNGQHMRNQPRGSSPVSRRKL